MISRRDLMAASAMLALGATGAGRAQTAPKLLRAVPQAEPLVFDPHQSQANVTSVHAMMVYDHLFGWDANMVPRPQMVESWTKSEDRLLYTFTLRPGLSFHDGSPVTTRDVVTSLKRMFVRDTQNQIFANLIASMDAVNDRTFTLRLRAPFNYVEFLLGGSNGVAGVIMREKEALTDPFTPVKELIGSGPFRFNKDEYEPGARLVYDKFAGYVPRKEPPSGFAGGKVVKVDRVELVVIPEPATAYAAIRQGEVDFLDGPTIDLLPTVVHDPNIVVGEVWPIETYAVLRFNSLYPPFNNLKAREAVAHAVSQKDYLTAAFGDPKYWRECYAFWVCGSPNGTEIGSDAYRKPDLDLARKLVKEAGYQGEKVVIIAGSDVPAYRQMSMLTADLLQKIGMNVDLQMMDWGTVTARRAKKDPPDKGGWNIFHTSANGAQLASPLTSPSTITTCDGKNFVGWPCDQTEEDMRMEYIRETDPVKQRALLEMMHTELWKSLPYVPLGQFKQPFVWRKNVTGVLKTNTLVYWNIEKT
ncbi:MAG TPA: ABC transporter substrate-binding protein [Acetobacteraceae bacterium]|jgi:peptide/nickel transport system substrate-binding protein|nr:ABC transporter substrate-binding protein [Acetobacteraceae bacterium]